MPRRWHATGGSSKRARVLAIVRTDATFRRQIVRGEDLWVGKCLHCGARLAVTLAGEALSGVTVEHIVPRHHGGGDELENLALACGRCNHGKGIRHDSQRHPSARAQAVIAALLERRRARWRNPEP